MSTEIGTLMNAGSRSKDIKITRYFGSAGVGPCIQLTQEMEDGSWGYVQLSKEEFVVLKNVLLEYVFGNKDTLSTQSILSSFEFSDEYINEIGDLK